MFCGNCGKSIANNVTRCPYCGVVDDAVGGSTPTSTTSVSVPIPRGQATGGQEQSRLTRAEQTLYFRIARGFSWFLLIIISIAMVLVAIQLVPALSQVVWTSTDVSAKDLTQPGTSPRWAAEADENEINPGEMAQLDQVAYEIIQLLPADVRANVNIDSLRGEIKNSANQLSRKRKEQMSFLEELRDDLREIPEVQRGKAFGNYFVLKGQRIQLDQTKKEAAKGSFVLLGSSMLSGIALVTFITMILVLLSIERNTRVPIT